MQISRFIIISVLNSADHGRNIILKGDIFEFF